MFSFAVREVGKTKKNETSKINEEVPKDSTLHTQKKKKKKKKTKDNDINEVGETSTSLDKIIQKVETVESTLLQTRIEKEETNKIENNKSIEIINKIQNKDKTINIISSKVDNQLFFFML